MNITSPFQNQYLYYEIGVNCGSYGKAKLCGSCPIIYSKESCFGDCGWMLNKTTQEYDCVARGKDNMHLNRKVKPYILFQSFSILSFIFTNQCVQIIATKLFPQTTL